MKNYIILANFIDDKNNVIFLLSIAFVAIIVILWLVTFLVTKSIKKKNHYKALAKQELASLGFSEFEDKKKINDKDDQNQKDNSETTENSVTEDKDILEENETKIGVNETDINENEIDNESNINEQDIKVLVEDIQTEDEVTEDNTEVSIEDVNTDNEEKVDASENFDSEQKEIEDNNEIPDSTEYAESEKTEIQDNNEMINDADTELENGEDVGSSSEDDIVKPENVDESEEKPKPVKKGRTYNGKYEIYQVADGYAYHLKASNGEILVTSETYRSRDGVLKAIDAVKRNLETGEVRIFADKRGKYKFKLVSKNYRVLAISSNYSVEKSATRASESFKKFAVKADIVDIELVDADAKTATIIPITVKEDKDDGRFVVEKYDGEYSWDLKASNGQILCQAEGYTSKAGCYYSIETFKKNVETGTFKCIKDKTGRYCYKLYNANGRVCAVGESYNTKAGAESAANSVVAYFKLAEVVEVKN